MAALLTLLVLAVPAAANEPAPDFEAASLDGQGNVALRDFRGQVVLLNGWATWCEPCRKEMPLLEDLHQEFASDGVRVIGVSIDHGNADDRVREFAAETGVSFTLLRDPANAFSRTFHTTGVPETLLIGRNGELLYRWKGPLTGDEADRARIEEALAGNMAVETGVTRVGFAVAFAAGLLSFLSPCVLPLVPVYAGLMTGLSLETLTSSAATEQTGVRRVTMRNGLLFVLGFSAVFVALGASATMAGSILIEHRIWIARAGGAFLIVLGLQQLGVLRLPWVERTARLPIAGVASRRAGALLLGIAFGAAWTPCIGPALATILTMAAVGASVGDGIALLSVYAVGLAIPFLLATVALERFLSGARQVRRWMPLLQKASGALTLLVAALLLTDSMTQIAGLASRLMR